MIHGVQPQPTAVERPVHLRIADDIRLRIERGELAPEDPLPTLHELAHQWHCSMTSARAAVALLKEQGLISGSRGKPPVVRTSPQRVSRSSDRHKLEKDMVRRPEHERRRIGAAEMDMGIPIYQLELRADYDVVPACADLAARFKVDPGAELLRRVYETADPASGRRLSWSVSYVPHELFRPHPELLDPGREPWPGGTQHQLYVAGIELAQIVDEVSAAMPTTVDAQVWGMDRGVPMLHIRRVSIDTTDRVVEISDSDHPADRTELHFTTPLPEW